MVIGPRGVGKTHWVMTHDAAFAAKMKKRSAGTGGVLSTQVVEIANKVENVQIHSGNDVVPAKFSLQLLDFPGENIGDHCTLPFDLRCDVLVLMLPEDAFNPELDSEDEVLEISTSQDLNKFFRPGSADSRARDYLYALYFGLNVGQDGSTTNVAGRQRFGIGSFVLIVNTHGGSPRYGSTFRLHVDSLAARLARKFGMEDKSRCFTYYCNISETRETILADAIGSLHSAKVEDPQNAPLVAE